MMMIGSFSGETSTIIKARYERATQSGIKKPVHILTMPANRSLVCGYEKLCFVCKNISAFHWCPVHSYTASSIFIISTFLLQKIME